MTNQLRVAIVGDNIKVLVNGCCEMESPKDDFFTVSSFLDSLVEMFIITDEQREAKIKRLKKVLDLE